MAAEWNLESALRPRGRPKKKQGKTSPVCNEGVGQRG